MTSNYSLALTSGLGLVYSAGGGSSAHLGGVLANPPPLLPMAGFWLVSSHSTNMNLSVIPFSFFSFNPYAKWFTLGLDFWVPAFLSGLGLALASVFLEVSYLVYSLGGPVVRTSQLL